MNRGDSPHQLNSCDFPNHQYQLALSRSKSQHNMSLIKRVSRPGVVSQSIKTPLTAGLVERFAPAMSEIVFLIRTSDSSERKQDKSFGVSVNESRARRCAAPACMGEQSMSRPDQLIEVQGSQVRTRYMSINTDMYA